MEDGRLGKWLTWAMGLVRDSKAKWKRTGRWLSGYSTYHTSQRIRVGTSESKLVIREVWWHTCNSAWEGWEKDTRARWLGDYHDCWSSRTEWDSLPQNKVEEWTRRNSDIKLGLPFARTHMYNHTHVNMNTNTHDTHGKKKKRIGGKWLKKAPNIHLCVSHAHTHTRACMSMHTYIHTKVEDGL